MPVNISQDTIRMNEFKIRFNDISDSTINVNEFYVKFEEPLGPMEIPSLLVQAPSEQTNFKLSLTFILNLYEEHR